MLTMLVSMFTVMASAVATDETPATKEPATAHKCATTDLTFVVPGREATCTEDGLVECYRCVVCGQLYSKREAAETNKITKQQTIPATGHQWGDVIPASAGNCEVKSNVAYQQCDNCEAYSIDGGKTVAAYTDVFGDYGDHDIVRTPAQAASCTKDGYSQSAYCRICNKVFEAKTTVPAMGHELEKREEVPATCTTSGTKQYFTCKRCGKDFANATDTAPTAKPMAATDKTIKPLGHKLTKVEAVAPTQEKEGHTVYWKCETCGKLFADKECTKEITLADTVLPKLTPSKPKVEERTLTVKIGENGKLVHKDDGREVTNGHEFDLKGEDEDNKEDKLVFVAKAEDDYTVVWTFDGEKHDAGKSEATISISYSDLKATGSKLTVSFKEVTTATRKLYVDVTGWSRGDIDYKFFDGKDWKSWDDFTSSDSPIKLKKGQKVRFELDADSGYVAKWAIDKDAKSFKTDFTVTYDEIKNGSTLYVSFVKKGSSDADDYPTLTFDITGAKHGTVYRGTREYEHGDVISIKKNDKMTFKAKADKGYVAVWTYKGDTYVGDEYTVKMGSTDAKLYVEFMDKDDIRLTELPFRDVSKRDWYYDDVVYVYRKGYMDGMSSTRFGGELNTTRGQIVTILWRLTGEPRATRNNPFNDVSSRQYYYDAISWAYDAGVVDGFDAHTFKPDQNVTREQLAAILYRYAEYMNLSTSGSAYLAKYRDADKIASWAYDAMAWANYHGLINGTSATRIDPKGYATRAQIAAILHRFAVEFGA